MTALTLTSLVNLVPKETDTLSGVLRYGDLMCPVYALSDPAFGWKFVQSFSRANRSFPACVKDPVLHEAYWHCRSKIKQKGGRIEQALALSLPTFALKAAVLEALLLTDLCFARIGQLLNLPTETVEAYETLFWNVRDRRKDQWYISQLVYPESRVELLETRDDKPTTREVLLRAAFEFGPDEVLFLAGMTPAAARASGRNGWSELEDRIMENGRDLARNGFLNRKSVPGLRQAVQILAARQKQAEPEPLRDKVGLHSIGDAVIEELHQIVPPAMMPVLDKSQRDWEEKKKTLDAQLDMDDGRSSS